VKQTLMPTLFVFSTLFLVSCAHHTPTNPLQAAWRVEDKGAVTTGMPNFVLSPEVFEVARVQPPDTRAPASDAAMAQELEEKAKRPSLRRLYFRTLYQQFRELKTVTKSPLQMNSCPQFHHDKLMMDDERSEARPTWAPADRPDMAELAYYPEWLLPERAGKHAKPIWQKGAKGVKLMTNALRVHTKKLHRELGRLCDEGSTDAYFRLENMVTYFSGHPQMREQKGLPAFLKIPVFSTMFLLKTASISSEHFNEHDHNLIDEVQGLHFERYIVELRKRRTSHE